MIDIHNHIIAGVDDGPDINVETISLLKQAKKEGITGVIATPHHLHTKYSNDFNEVKKRVEELNLQEEIKELGISIYPGQEIRITDQIIIGIEQETIKGLNDSKYLLIEFPSNEVPYYTKQLFFEIQGKGYIPVIAHPERNKAIIQNVEILFDLISGGALSQITSTSLAGNLGKKIQKFSLQLLKNNLTHFISSDAHNTAERPFIMNSLIDNKKLNIVENEMKQCIENAEKLIDNQDIIKDIPSIPKKNKFWLF
ncbi:tyrosine-protein phosphatase [Staphylococcus debuckii]|uniref:Tyrosine-protein phosphatase n=1 Tax=Staphylococcus debuckii TaxID=2044912 RepID=A0ABU9F0P5_9STAP|nr:CpsB/CapC family capsule biosynthesis tyrosine phosphatase [Staphylococcus debuckii]AYU56113.1 capsular biosynthesis protein [Staphylococcus debuckii]